MANYKVTFFFEYGNYGRSMSFYKVADEEKHEDIEVDAHALAKVIMPLMGGGVELPYVRVSNVDSTRDASKITTGYYNLKTGETAAPGSAYDVTPALGSAPDFGWTTGMCELVASSKKKGRVFIPFLPDEVTNNTVGKPRKKAWNDAFKEFQKHLKAPANGWKIRTKVKDDTTKPREILHTELALDPSFVTHELAEDHGWAVGTTVFVTGFAKYPKLVGKYKTYASGDTKKVKLKNAGFYTFPAALDFGGKISIAPVEYSQIINVEEPFIRERKGGRPFDAPVGRRKRR